MPCTSVYNYLLMLFSFICKLDVLNAKFLLALLRDLSLALIALPYNNFVFYKLRYLEGVVHRYNALSL